MDIYLEKEFLDNLYLSFDEPEYFQSKQTLIELLTKYGNINYIIDVEINEPEDLEMLKRNNPYFSYVFESSSVINTSSLEEHFSNRKDIDQVLILGDKLEEWHKNAEKLGALYLNFNNYGKKLDLIREKCTVKIDLSENFEGWTVLQDLSPIPINRVLINDGYILTDKRAHTISQNLNSIINNLFKQRSNSNVSFHIFTKDLNPKRPGTDEQIKNEARTKKVALLNYFNKYGLSFQIINNDLKRGYDFHDRILLSNYFLIDCPRGFNLIPYKQSNSQISIETIFDKYSYKRICNLKEMHKKYMKSLDNLETVRFKSI